MRISTTRVVLAAACASVASVALSACQHITPPPYFGPGSAPNSNTNTQGSTATPGSFTAVAPMSVPRAGLTATLLPNGKVLVVGGRGDSNAPAFNLSTEAELYDPTANTWSTVSSLNQANPNNGRLMDATNAFPIGLEQHTAVLTQTGTVLIAGGLGYDALINGKQGTNGHQGEGALDDVFTFNPGTNTFTRVQNMPVRRYFHLAQILSDGTVMEAGGFNAIAPFATGIQTLKSADIYNPGTGAWASVPLNANPPTAANAPASGSGHTWGNFVQFGPDVLLAFGAFMDSNKSQNAQAQGVSVFEVTPGVYPPGTQGSGGSFAKTGAESYSVASGLFTGGPTPTRPQVMLGGGTALSTGDVFFAGGENLPQGKRYVGALPDTEELVYSTKTFQQGPQLGSSAPPPTGSTTPTPTPRTECLCVEAGATADVLVVGGVDNQGQVTDQSEVWSHQYNIMLGIAKMQKARTNFAACKLQGGQQVLVVGGEDPNAQQNKYFSDVELWSR